MERKEAAEFGSGAQHDSFKFGSEAESSTSFSWNIDKCEGIAEKFTDLISTLCKHSSV